MLICPSLASQWIKPETAGQRGIGAPGATEGRPQEAARRPHGARRRVCQLPPLPTEVEPCHTFRIMTTFVVFVLMSAAIWAALACLALHVWVP